MIKKEYCINDLMNKVLMIIIITLVLLTCFYLIKIRL
jgi:hypothetical protein